MCSFITQHNATDVANFQGACNWHADSRNVHQSCCPWIECSFLHHKPSPKVFQKILQYTQLASQPWTTSNHTSPGPPHPVSSSPRSSETSHPDSCCHNRFAWPKNFCTNCQKPSQGSSSACLSSSSGSRPDCSSSSQPTGVGKCSHSMASGILERCSLHGWIPVFTVQGRWQTHVWWHVGEQFADVNFVIELAHDDGRVMVWAGIWYGQWTQGHFIDGILNAQRYCDEILRPIVVPFIHDHHLMLRHENARPHVARICTQLLEAEGGA